MGTMVDMAVPNIDFEVLVFSEEWAGTYVGVDDWCTARSMEECSNPMLGFTSKELF